MKVFYAVFMMIFTYQLFSTTGNTFPGRIEYDKFEKTTQYFGKSIALNRELSISFYNFNNEKYGIVILYEGKDWLFIQSGESLNLLIDEEDLITLTGNGSSMRQDVVVNHNVKVKEEARYLISTDVLLRILTANQVEIKVTGQRYYKTAIFNNQVKDNLCKVLDYFNDIPQDVLTEVKKKKQEEIESAKKRELEEIENAKKREFEEKELIALNKQKFKEELFKTDLAKGGHAFLVIGLVGLSAGTSLTAVGIGINNGDVGVAGYTIAVLSAPFIPLSSIFYGINYKKLKNKYLINPKLSIYKDKIEFAVACSF